MLVKINAGSVDLETCVFVKVGDRFAIIDIEDKERICGYTWHLKNSRYNYYAYRKKSSKGTIFLVYMHRQITHCPNNLIVHHKNHHGLDNRKSNLELMTAQAHHEFHKFG